MRKMLELINIGQREIIKLLQKYPGKKFTVREIMERLHTESSSTSISINKLMKDKNYKIYKEQGWLKPNDFHHVNRYWVRTRK